ncbi:hypothetical protein ES705_35124 [subsurface metagenome]
MVLVQTRRGNSPYPLPRGVKGDSCYLTLVRVEARGRMRSAVEIRARRRHDAAFGNRNINAGGYLVNG